MYISAMKIIISQRRTYSVSGLLVPTVFHVRSSGRSVCPSVGKTAEPIDLPVGIVRSGCTIHT